MAKKIDASTDIVTLVYTEPIYNDGKLKWLQIKKTNDTMIEDGKVISDGAWIVKDIEIKPEGLWQCRKCGCIATFLPHEGKPIECYESDGGCGRTSQFKVITAKINSDLWKIPKWIDIPVENLDMLNTYNDAVSLIKSTLVFVEDIQYKVLVLWIFSTYKLDDWNTVGTPFFEGLPDSGKTKGLDVIRELAWRMIHASNCTFIAMIRASHIHSAGVLIDEVENKLSTKKERGQEMLEFIKPGYRRGSKYIVGDKEDPLGIISYNNYGFRALAGEILWDNAMRTRCIGFEMEKDRPFVEDISKVQAEFDRIQNILFNYKYKTGNPPELPEDFELHGRIREIFESIIRTGMHIGLDVEDVIDFAKRYEKEQMAEFQSSIEREILDTIYTFETSGTLDDAPEVMYFADICERMEWTEKDQKQQLGYIIRGKTMHLPSYRNRKGKILKLQDPKTHRMLKYLYKRYGVVENV